MSSKTKMRILAAVLSFGGLGVILYWDWVIGVGVFMFMWGENIYAEIRRMK